MTTLRQAEGARLLMRAFADAGLRDVVLCPGSRSTPLVLALVKEPRLAIHEVIDERAAAFFALGQARVTGRPSLMITTSGTAGAHAYPAILEAEASGLPFLIATADRPLELQDCGALQTIDQRDLFGHHVRASFEVPLGAFDAVARIAAQAYSTGLAHLNIKAAKPLEVDATEVPAVKTPRIAALKMIPGQEIREQLSQWAAEHERGVIVAGPMSLKQAGLCEAVHDLSERTGWPLLAEATSQLRFAKKRPRFACDVFEPLLRSERFRKAHVPSFVLQLGATPTSAGFDVWIRENQSATRVILAEHGYPDPAGGAGLVVSTADLLDTIAGIEAPLRTSFAWAESFKNAENRARTAALAEIERGGEAALARTLVVSAREDALLFVGNGLPIRHLDLYAPGELNRLQVLSQRGASGIDGNIAGAAGAASVANGKPVIAFIGDVAALHDLSSLCVAKSATSPLVLVVVNNQGGRIFEQLPIGAHPESARFTTPHHLELATAAQAFGIETCPIDQLRSALEKPGCTLIESRVGAHDARDAYARIWRTTS
jgi:2-succinyl-5-enolpyruvyl-6-hydroxy-3-cyclohexene-1-carboxylate synthase